MILSPHNLVLQRDLKEKQIKTKPSLSTLLGALFRSSRGIVTATAVFTAALLAIALVRAYPFNDDVNPTISAGNDWLTYKANALSILRDGLSMPRVAGSYARPGGFLYNYFVAGVFALTSVNSKHVYLAQTVLLGLSVGLMTLAFKAYLNQLTPIYFLLLAVPYSLEVFFVYTFRLLSENLVIFLLALFCFCGLAAFRKRSVALAVVTGVIAGLCALCRPNLILLPFSTALLFLLYVKGKVRILVAAVFLAASILTFGLLPLRNYVVTKQASLSALTYTGDWEKPDVDFSAPLTAGKLTRAAVTSLGFYGRRVLFCFGLTTFRQFDLSPYWLRPHWIIMWAGAFLFCWQRLKQRRPEFWEAFAMTFVLFYLTPLIAVAQIHNYGVRMIVPVLPMLLLMAVAGAGAKVKNFSGYGKDEPEAFKSRA